MRNFSKILNISLMHLIIKHKQLSKKKSLWILYINDEFFFVFKQSYVLHFNVFYSVFKMSF